MDKFLDELLMLSHAVGGTPSLVQGGGGNTSVKKGDQMYIKASGGFLSEMTQISGFTIVDVAKIRAYYEQEELQAKNSHVIEGRAVSFINALAATDARPSMEAAMHAFLGRVTVHTHPVFVNVLNCLTDGEKRVALLASVCKIDRFVWVPYQNPGYNLARTIRACVLTAQKMPQVFFLQNHGIIVTMDSVDEALSVTLQLNARAAEMCHATGFSVPPLQKISDDLYYAEGVYQTADVATPFFPDCVVYAANVIGFVQTTNAANALLKNSEKKIVVVKNGGIFYKGGAQKVRAMHETLCAQIFLAQKTRAMGQPHALMAEDVQYIAEMEMERYRENRLV